MTVDMVEVEFIPEVCLNTILGDIEDPPPHWGEDEFTGNTKVMTKGRNAVVFMTTYQGLTLKVDRFTDAAKSVPEPMIRLRYNPSKVDPSVILDYVDWARKVSDDDGTIMWLDVCVDLPVKYDRVIVQSRKRLSTVDTTRYYGLKGKHGQVKVYDKRAERLANDGVDLGYDLTRVEYTLKGQDMTEFVNGDTDSPFTDKIGILPQLDPDTPQVVTSATDALAVALLRLQASGYPSDDLLKGLHHRDGQTVRQAMFDRLETLENMACDARTTCRWFADQCGFKFKTRPTTDYSKDPIGYQGFID